MAEIARVSPEELAAITERHRPDQEPEGGAVFCASCCVRWPCDAEVLRCHIAALDAECQIKTDRILTLQAVVAQLEARVKEQTHHIALLENALRTLQIDFAEIGGTLQPEHGAPE